MACKQASMTSGNTYIKIHNESLMNYGSIPYTTHPL